MLRLLLLVAICPSLCLAQTTIYGSVAVAVRHSTNAAPTGAGMLALTGSNLGNGILGVRGTEQISDGWRARYRIEAGFLPDTGAQRGNALFGRETSVGIDTPFGKLDAGHLQHVGGAAEALVRTDPANGAGQLETVWPGFWSGARFDNAVRYRYERGPAFASVLASAGEQASGARNGRLWALGGGYLGPQLMAVSFYQLARDGRGLQATAWATGGVWRLPALSLHAAYMHARRDKGFTIGTATGSALSGVEMAFAGLPAPAPQDTRFALLGVTVPVAPAWRVRAAVYKAHSRGATLLSANRGGTQDAAYIILSNELSRRTSLLFTVDWNHWQGGWSRFWGASNASLAALAPDGADSRRTVSAGILHNF